MAVNRIRRGLRLPIQGQPASRLDESRPCERVALLGADYIGLRPTLHVALGDAVARGQLLFEDKSMRGVRFTSPGAGRVVAIHRGPRRIFESIVIELSAAERARDRHGVEHARFESSRRAHPRDLAPHEVVELLLESGHWTALRARPFSRVADPARPAAALFVTATDTHPLAPPIPAMLHDRDDDLERGLHAIAKLTQGPVFVCADAEARLRLPKGDRFRLERFQGPHPAGVVGTHVHRLFPVGRERRVWHVGIQEVLAIGALFETGHLDVRRIVSLAGPGVREPRLLRTRIGASVPALSQGELTQGDLRLISGSVFSGRKAMGDVHGFLGRYHQQVSVIPEDRRREFLGWMAPTAARRPVAPTLLSRLLRRRPADVGSGLHGSPRAIVPIGLYEKVLPLDVEPAYLLKALMVEDAQWAETLGCLELDEEDVALCSFVCPSKSDFGTQLRRVLTAIERESS